MCDSERFSINLDGYKDVEPDTLSADELQRFVGCAAARACAFTQLAMEQADTAQQQGDRESEIAYTNTALLFQRIVGKAQLHKPVRTH